MNPPAPIKLLLVDDHPVVRAGLRTVEDLAPDIRVVGEAATIEEALARIHDRLPHVVLLDLRLADGDGLEVCRRTKDRYPNIRVICLTSYTDTRLVLAAMEAGVDGYLLKHNDARTIVEAVRSVMAGRTVFDPALEAASPGAAGGRANPLERLSDGELRVLGQVAKGRTDKEVSTVLNLSAKTVRHYLDRAFAKLGVHTRTQAAIVFASHPRPARADAPEDETPSPDRAR
ncbi:MAG TPA: response regulator transcription factor [Verrucomicrobiota bacterium]|nr:response regulator transcription factor [Verrucomicrobiota bacterium]